MKTRLCTINVHSLVDVITNSSTELFCVVKAKSTNVIEKVITEILKECGCRVLSDDNKLTVQYHEEYDEDTNTYHTPEGQYDICYEQHAPPCDLIVKKLKEKFEIV
jgi:hypothetical protein